MTRLLPLALLLLAGCGGYLQPGGAAPWCKTIEGRHDCRAANAERDSIAKADTTRKT